MKKALLIGIVVASVVVLGCGITTAAEYNSLVTINENVDHAQADILTSLQSRDSLVGQLVTAAGTYLTAQSDIYDSITDARTAYATAVASGNYADIIAADSLTSAALTSVIAVVEDTPELTGEQTIIDLMSTMESLEYTLKVSRDDYNDTVAAYNASIKRFPKLMFAKMFGYDEPKPYWSKTNGDDIVVVFPSNA